MPKQRPPRRLVKLRESAVTAERAALTEATTGAVQPIGSGRMLIQLINEGRGSSGAYPASVLEAAARNRVFHQGLAIHANHPTAEEEQSRPERNVLDWVGQLVEDGRYDPARRALVAEAQIFRPWREVFLDPDFAAAVGLSIRASGIAEHGTFEGQPALVVSEITEAQSVDFVTKAGRGGKVLALLESARARLSEAPTEQTRTALDKAIRDAYSSDDRYAWVRDWDPARSVVWFDLGGPDGGTWEQSYLTSGGECALIGPRREVKAVTVYQPTTTPAPADADLGESGAPTTDVTDGAPPTGSPTTPEEESAVAETQTGAPPVQAGTAPVVDTPPALQDGAVNTAVVEALRALTTQVTSLTEANATLSQRLDQRDAADQSARNRITAREAVSTALTAPEVPADLRARISPRVTATVLAAIPVAESGDVDDTALAESIRSAIDAESGYVAELLESAGVGRPRGLGSAAPKVQTADEFSTVMTEAFRAIGLDEKTAAVAGKGRG